MYHHYAYAGMPFLGPIGGLLHIIFWIAVIALIFKWIRPHLDSHSQERHHEHNDRMKPEDILAERFAKGEIEEKEFKARLEILKSHFK